MSELTQTERLTRGSQAEAELPTVRRALATLRARLLDAIAKTPFEAAENRERLYLSVNLLPAIEDMLIEAISDGVLAKSEIEIAQHINAAAEGRAVN